MGDHLVESGDEEPWGMVGSRGTGNTKWIEWYLAKCHRHL